MDETKNNSAAMKNLKYIFVLVGIAAVVLAYVMVYSGYSSKAETLDDEIDTLDSQYKNLKNKASIYNEDDVNSFVATSNMKYNSIMSEFDGGISYQSQIMDTYNMTKVLDIQIPSLTMSGVSDVIDETDTTAFLTSKQYVEQTMTYEISTVASYDRMKEVISYILDFEGRRKVPNSIAFSYDTTTQLVALRFTITEYAIAGEDRPASEVIIPEYDQGSTNIFYNEVIKLD